MYIYIYDELPNEVIINRRQFLSGPAPPSKSAMTSTLAVHCHFGRRDDEKEDKPYAESKKMKSLTLQSDDALELALDTALRFLVCF